jgi:ubiquinone biosynthesis accessory factor UbiK
VRKCTIKFARFSCASTQGKSTDTPAIDKLKLMTIDELVSQLRSAFTNAAPANAGEDLQKNLRATLSAGLSKLDVVTRQEFEIQREMLDALRKQIDELAAQVESLEARKTPR